MLSNSKITYKPLHILPASNSKKSLSKKLRGTPIPEIQLRFFYFWIYSNFYDLISIIAVISLKRCNSMNVTMHYIRPFFGAAWLKAIW